MKREMGLYHLRGSRSKSRLSGILDALPPELKRAIQFLSEEERNQLEEIRLRIGVCCTVTKGGREFGITREGKLFPDSSDGQGLVRGIPVTSEHIAYLVGSASQGSLYAAEDTLREGYITLPGGHRVGICGHAVTENGKITTIKRFSSACVRIARAATGAASSLAHGLVEKGRVSNTLILSPPLGGKTTLLRDIVRELSKRGFRIGVADERGELAGMVKGEPQFDLGGKTDTLDGCKKAEGAMLLLRGMAPDVLVMDEITAAEDVSAVLQAAHCGVAVLATAHAADFEEFAKRSAYAALIEAQIFGRVVELFRQADGHYGKLFSLGGTP
jgi:stage III sporulation protein AA